ncbi:GTPase of the mitochondrial inner membrane that associates with the large ribosomal subunit [Scheffersomyces spartinae]|uniref:GTPase of the mitochondrial inner membrane that associates with the large ribosomal subunit n=1 Tax=Scheffersomyces spartinae TaxID=45513 RepID=A0A9P7V8E6_9ASCO|nr:GTPase of the mitochondrial inner membrane that associates with the large ribosomal subunit [Scheffersomyces spartinae]KAG7193330.1 GTPase of the mitochondrial inner membrane that associates with the large ribosomal subunit [Scheffersomyces spartinae]
MLGLVRYNGRVRFLFPTTSWMSRRSGSNSSSWLDELEPEPKSEDAITEALTSANYSIHTDKVIGDDYDAASTIGPLQGIDLGTNEAGISSTLVLLKNYFGGNEHHTHQIFLGSNIKYKQGRKTEQRTFEDLKLLRLKSGNGGNGCISFFRDAFRPVGPPDGGDGGEGGNVYVQVVEHVNSLHRLRRSYVASNGYPGTGKQLDGKRGQDVILEIPVGTTMRWIPDPIILRKVLQSTGAIEDVSLEIKTSGDEVQFVRESYPAGHGWKFTEHEEEYYRERDFFQDLNKKVMEYDEEIINDELFHDKFPLLGFDFSQPTKEPLLILRGGKGGMGNMHFLTKDIRNPRFCKQGRSGLTEFFLLELKLIADLGLVGLPNAGKSTLLRAISKARPRVGHWEFTTLQPTIGTIFTTIDKDPFTVADIPGIIKGASENRGMGLDFLRHIERSGGLVFVVSLESEDPIKDLDTLIDEVGEQRMEDKRILVVATKADLAENGQLYHQLKDYVEDRQWKIVPVCATQGHNIEKCIKMMSETAQG